MEALCLRNLISSASENFRFRGHISSGRLGKRFGQSNFVFCSKKFDFQDFQGFARPLRLLPAKETNLCTESSLKEISTSFRTDESQSLYMVKLHTSGAFGSSLSDITGGILLCLIDVNGNSILQRIPATSSKNLPQHFEAITLSDHPLLFQRGAINEFTFEGPKLGKIAALWVGLESGLWRLGGVSLKVLSNGQPSFNSIEENGKPIYFNGLKYDFEEEDILLGEGGDMSMVELRPHRITELNGLDLMTLLNTDYSLSSLSNWVTLNDESMKEYADLKFSLLLYDGFLIFIGTLMASFSSGDKAALAFLTGGFCGFLYLLLLQRSVDGLPAPASNSMNRAGENFNELFNGLKGPVSSLAIVMALTFVAVKYGSGDAFIVLTPKELIIGMMGFLLCKIAVVLAAFKPMNMGLKENE